jgi:serine/threonine protein kinase/Tfp pilus assembly protein PilF
VDDAPRGPLGRDDQGTALAEEAGTVIIGPGTLPTVAGYQILGELGRGNMGVVYQARQIGLNRLVALKMIRAGARAGPDELRRFMAEAQLLASLQHPNIIQIYEVSLQHDVPFFSMEYVEGGTLAERLEGRPLPVRQAAHLVQILAETIQVAHDNNIVHRDLKPANVLLDTRHAERRTQNALKDQRAAASQLCAVQESFCIPKITDFGLAKQLRSNSQTESGMIMGTPNYMAPEQAEGRSRDVGPAADVYALGAILYELLTGRPPYVAESPMETVLLLFQAEPVPPSRLQPKVPRDLETICLKCLQREPRRRYASALALAADLRSFLAGEPIAARPPSAPERVWKWACRRPALATLLACAVAVGLAGIGLLAWHQLDLREKLDQARADERAARAAQEAADARERLAGLRAKVEGLLGSGAAALKAGDGHNAELQLVSARDQIASEPGLEDLRRRADVLLEQARAQRADRERYQQFVRWRNEALFNATLFTGGDLVSSLQGTRTAARQALALYGVAVDASAPLQLEGNHLTEAEKSDVRAGCYELLLVLAEAESQPLPGQDAARREATAAQALALLDRAAALGLTTRAYHLRRAHYLARLGELAAAQRERERAAALQPSSALDYFLMGEEQYRQNNCKQAIGDFQDALQLQPSHFWARYYLALCWLKTRRWDLAASGFTACLGWRPDFVWLYVLRGSAWVERGQFASAEADFERARQGPLDDAVRFALLMHRGVLRVKQGRLHEALADLRQAVELRPDQFQGRVNLAQAYARQGDLDEAVHQLNEAIRLEGGVAALYRTRAQFHRQRQDFAAAQADLEKAIRLDAEHSSLALADDQMELGKLLHRRKDFAAAVQAYDASLLLRPYHALTHRLRAEALLELNRLPEALESLDECVKQGPADADVLRVRAAIRARQGQYTNAVGDYTRALELAPTAATYAVRGWVHIVTEAPKLALADFDEAIRLDPTSGDAYCGRGHARVLLGQFGLAADDAEEALRRGPESARLDYNVARLYARAAGKLEEAAFSRSGRPPVELIPTYRNRAVELLGKALEQTPPAQRAQFWQTCVQSDTALNAIRRTPGFAQLAARYGKPPS